MLADQLADAIERDRHVGLALRVARHGVKPPLADLQALLEGLVRRAPVTEPDVEVAKFSEVALQVAKLAVLRAAFGELKFDADRFLEKRPGQRMVVPPHVNPRDPGEGQGEIVPPQQHVLMVGIDTQQFANDLDAFGVRLRCATQVIAAVRLTRRSCGG